MPKLLILSIFGSIVLDIMCSYGPLFPVQQYTLATTFLSASSRISSFPLLRPDGS